MSIDVNVQNDLVIVTESSEDIVVNVSNATGPQGPAGPAGQGVPVGGSTGQVLKKFSATNYDTYWAADASGLTSVGLSMPTAFAVSNSPLTSNGTLAVTAVGTSAQYIRGDGQLATLPSGVGGGSSVNYYLNGSVSQGTIGGSVYYEMNRTPVIGIGTDFTRTNLQGNGIIAQFITDANDPNRLEIPAGSWNFEMFFNASSPGGTPSFYVDLLKYNGTTFTSIATGSTNPEEITGGTTTDLYLTSLAVPQTTLLATDRLVIRVYVITSGRDITLHTEDNNLCEILTTFAGGVSALNGLTANTQYFTTGTSGTDFAISSLSDTHTFNLPTASAINRGALSSTDWTTFNNKQNAITLTTTGSSGASTFVSNTLNVPTYTLAGLGGVPTSRTLTINGTAYDLSADRSWTISTAAAAGSNTQIQYNNSGVFGASSAFTYNDSIGEITLSKNQNAQTRLVLTNTTNNANAKTEIAFNGSLSGLFTMGKLSDSYPGFLIFQPRDAYFYTNTGDFSFFNNGLSGKFKWAMGQSGIAQMTLTAAGRLLLGTTIESTYLLDVNGAARINGVPISIGAAVSLTSNIAIGLNVLRINSTGFNNTIGGTNSMYDNTTGNANSGWGVNSLRYNISGSENTAFGNDALFWNDTGNYNTAIGTRAARGTGSTYNTSGSNNIFIGYNSIGELSTESNRTWIGNTNTTSTWVGGNLLVGIRTDAGYRLDVNGTARISSDLTINGVLQETVTTNRQTSSYTLALADRGKLVEMNVATANNLTVPLNSSVAFAIGTKIDLAQYGAGQTTVVADSGVTVRSAGGALKFAAQYSGATLVKIATNEWYLFGNITT